MTNIGSTAALKRSTQDVIGKGALDKAAQAVSSIQKSNVIADNSAITNISSNPFYKILLDPNTDPEEKVTSVAKLFTFAGTKEENSERVKQWDQFEEFIQDAKKKMSVSIINMTNTKTFSLLQQCYERMNGSLVDFDDKMKPLLEIIDAIYELRTDAQGNKILDTFKEIQEDKQKEKIQQDKKDQIAKEIAEIDNRVSTSRNRMAILSEQKGFFGFGNVKESARQEIATLQAQQDSDVISLLDHRKTLEEMKMTTESSVGDADFARRKAKLRELLDLSSETHVKRQEDLVKTALQFVENASKSVDEVRSNLGQMDTQLDKLEDSNQKLSGIYAVTTEAFKVAETENQRIRQTLQSPEADENSLKRMKREDRRRDLDRHIKTLDTSARNTTTAYADIEEQTLRINTMKDANDEQKSKARVMATQGISGVADRLSVVLPAVSSAAIGESSEMAKNSLDIMRQRTDAIAQREVIRIAMNGDELNKDLVKAIDSLSVYGEVYRTATDISRNTVTQMRQSLDTLREQASQVNRDVKNAIAVNAEVALSERQNTTGSASSGSHASGPNQAKSQQENPFNL